MYIILWLKLMTVIIFKNAGANFLVPEKARLEVFIFRNGKCNIILILKMILRSSEYVIVT